MKIGDNTIPVRTSRFTRDSEVFAMGRWTQMGGVSSNSSSTDKPFELGLDELSKIDGRAGIRPQEYVIVGEAQKILLRCSVYHGTSHSLSELTVKLEIKETDTQKVLNRDYRLWPKNGVVVQRRFRNRHRPCSSRTGKVELGNRWRFCRSMSGQTNNQPRPPEDVAALVESLTNEMLAFCGPIFITPGLMTYPEQMIDNGTFSLIDTGERRLLVTCYHVWQAYLNCRKENSDGALGINLGDGDASIAFAFPERPNRRRRKP